MHETLEMKEDEIAQLRSKLKQATAQKEELQEQKERADKSGEWCKILRKKNASFSEIIALHCIVFPPKLLRSLSGPWVSLRRRRRRESSCRFTWRSK